LFSPDFSTKLRERRQIVNDRLAWSVGLSFCSEPCRKLGSDRDTVCVQDSDGPREKPVTYSGLLRANAVLCLFNTIQPSSWVWSFVAPRGVLWQHIVPTCCMSCMTICSKFSHPMLQCWLLTLIKTWLTALEHEILRGNEILSRAHDI